MSTSDLEQTKQFLLAVLPWPSADEEGYINLHWTNRGKEDPTKKFWSGKPFRDVDAMIDFSQWLNAQGEHDIYFCTSRQRSCGKHKKTGKPVAIRTQDNATHLKSVWLDIDVKDNEHGYPSLLDAMTATGEFVHNDRYSIPVPSAVVGSGGGIQVFWAFETASSVMRWLDVAIALKTLAKTLELHFDQAVTIDSARILRMPMTWNHKYNPKRMAKVLTLNDSSLLPY